MDVKEAVAKAKTYLSEVFENESVAEVRLEEVQYDETEGAWLVTLGLMRPSYTRGQGAMAALMSPASFKRTYKVVRIPDGGQEKPSIKIREIGEE
jgi:hypothetical protein